MIYTSLFIAWLVVSILFSLLCSSFVLLILNFEIAQGFFIFILCFQFVSLFCVELVIKKVLKNIDETGAWYLVGIKKTYDRVVGRLVGYRSIPRLLILNEPSCNALVIKSLGGRGSILVSRGLLNALNESEMRALLEHLITLCQRKGLSLQSYFALMAHLVFSLMPLSWRALLLSHERIYRLNSNRLQRELGQDPLNFMQLVFFLPLLSIYRALLRFAAIGMNWWREQDLQNPVLNQAFLKIEKQQRLFPTQSSPAWSIVQIVKPYSNQIQLQPSCGPLEIAVNRTYEYYSNSTESKT